MLIAGTKPGDRWYREGLLLTEEGRLIVIFKITRFYKKNETFRYKITKIGRGEL